MTNMDAMPIYGKNLRNLLLYKHLADCLETRNVAFDMGWGGGGGGVYKIYINDDPGLILTYFTARLHFVL